MPDLTNCCSRPASTDTHCCPPPDKTAETNSCSPSVPDKKICCPPQLDRRAPGYRLEGFVKTWIETPIGNVPVVEHHLNRIDHLGHIAMRWGIGRTRYAVAPGIYAIGAPDAHAEVLVSANYKLSFDVLRRSLGDVSAWILVIDTKGINVWCAAGKGTFGTDEIIRCVKRFNLNMLVDHRRLILPQLGAPGVAAHLVKKGCDFSVVYGPVRAQDLPAFFAYNRQATPAMRRVNFTLVDRIILTPVELTNLYRQIFYAALALLLLGGIGSHIFSISSAWTRGGAATLTGLSGLVAGAVITPILLPWLPGRAFAVKGVWAGLAVAILLGGGLLADAGNLIHIALLLQVMAISSFAAMNFTGSSTYTSPSGVEKEMRIAIPCQLTAVITALGCWLWTAF